MEGLMSFLGSGFKFHGEAKELVSYKSKRRPLSKLMTEEAKQDTGTLKS